MRTLILQKNKGNVFIDFLKSIRKFFVLLFLGILEIFGHDVKPRLKVIFANRNFLRQKHTLLSSGSGQFKPGEEVDVIVKNGRIKKLSKPAIIVQDAGGLMVKVVIIGQQATSVVERAKLKRVSIIKKPAA